MRKMIAALFWVSALLLPLNVYFAAYSDTPAISGVAVGLNIMTMAQMWLLQRSISG